MPFDDGPDQGAIPPAPPPPAAPAFEWPELPEGGSAPPLQPMGVGELIDASITLYRRNWRPFMGIVALIYVPFLFLQQIVIRVISHPFLIGGRVYITPSDSSRVGIATTVFVLVSFLLVQPLATGAMVRAIADAYMGHRPTVRGVYGYALGVIWSLLLVIFLRSILVLVGLILLIIPGIIFYVRLMFATSVVVIEDARGRKALRRSWRLSRGSFWRIFGTTFLAGILAEIVAAIVTVPLALVAVHTTAGWLLNAIGSSVGQVLVAPFTTTIVVLLYFDVRIRKEGLDLMMMARDIRRESGDPQA